MNLRSKVQFPQGLKPRLIGSDLRGPEGPLFHGNSEPLFHGNGEPLFHGNGDIRLHSASLRSG